ncbi:MAG TPA: MnhB domain-containing protein [Kiritimatiellia bacterium]|jgi:multicomponent Na+:H+ antiporter subunit B|nr:sodium:proton antiporter [Kiritimatiellia bacterium]OQC59309.1 MAG: Na(+)/H(+) antiporter subunit B [Verrucomicrobia bacterium ADurb.Bin018]HOE00662.1 MnhB domain-containing protein [Kiritimatiellia bacterium]HOE36255.1 MnhB domain-containing protein [Kiritimatiellia bacterium]HOR73733.1 MnhB domain-containing protein [Kiritimatiellia bacterium]
MKMTKIVRTTADVFYPFCLAFGLYVVMHGHLTPGGGFQGGAVMATGAALLIVARSYEDITGRLRKGVLKVCEATGLMLFLLAGLSGLLKGLPFMANWLTQTGGWVGKVMEFGPNGGELATGGLIPLLNVGVGIEVLGGLSIILLYMISGTKEKKP